MARLYTPQNSDFPFHITARCPNRELFHTSLEDTWKIMEDYLFLSKIKFNLRIHSFVLMPNHFHLLATSLEHPIGRIMCEFMTNTSKEINQLTKRMNQNWGGRHFKCEINSYHYFLNVYKYVYQNPVRASLSPNCESWKYSTLNGIVGQSKLIIPIVDDAILFDGSFAQSSLKWLNTPIAERDLQSLRLALTKTSFKLQKIKGKLNHLEAKLI